jgi:hypothetical protein
MKAYIYIFYHRYIHKIGAKIFSKGHLNIIYRYIYLFFKLFFYFDGLIIF